MSEGDRYQIHFLGWIGARWEKWFDGLTVKTQKCGEQPITVLTGTVPDQAALRGLLCKAWDLNLVLLSLTREDPPLAQTSGPQRAEERQP